MSEEKSIIDITRKDITEYTEYEFSTLMDHIYEGRFSDEWQKEAIAMFERVVAHPDGLGLIYETGHPYVAYEQLRDWYKEHDLPFTKPDPVRPITDYTEAEFMELLIAIWNNEGTEEESDLRVEQYSRAVEHPKGTDLIYWPDDHDGNPEAVMNDIKTWYKENNKPCFKDH